MNKKFSYTRRVAPIRERCIRTFYLNAEGDMPMHFLKRREK